MQRQKVADTTYAQFVADRDRQRILEREGLAFEATELISSLMEKEGVSKKELAALLGRSRAFITQILSGSRNLTLHTLADVVFALGYRIELRAAPVQMAKDDQGYAPRYEFPDPYKCHGREQWGTGRSANAKKVEDEENVGSDRVA